MASLLWPPTVNESAQRGQPRCVQLGPLCAGKSNRPLDKLFLRWHLRPANSRFFGVHNPIIRDSKRLAIAHFLNHNNRMNKTCGIYKITSPVGKVYVGQSTHVESRLSDYKRLTGCKKQVRLYNSLKAHGAKTHVFEVVEECCAAQLNERERYWQDALNATGYSGLNCRLTATYDRSGLHSEPSKSLMRQKQGGANNPNYGKRGAEVSTFGRKRTEAERAAIKAYQATRGRIVQQFDAVGTLLKEGRVRDFTALGFSQGNISSCCSGRLQAYKCYTFKYKETP